MMGNSSTAKMQTHENRPPNATAAREQSIRRRKPVTTAMSLRWLKAAAGCRALSPAALSLAILIRERLDRAKGVAWFGLEYAEAYLGFKHSALSKAIRQLEEAGFIETVRTDRRRSNEYVLKFGGMLRIEESVAGELLQLKARRVRRELGLADALEDGF